MNIEFKIPNINAPTVEGQIAQIRSYLFQLAEQLNYSFNVIDDSAESNKSTPSDEQI